MDSTYMRAIRQQAAGGTYGRSSVCLGKSCRRAEARTGAFLLSFDGGGPKRGSTLWRLSPPLPWFIGVWRLPDCSPCGTWDVFIKPMRAPGGFQRFLPRQKKRGIGCWIFATGYPGSRVLRRTRDDAPASVARAVQRPASSHIYHHLPREDFVRVWTFWRVPC